MIAINARVLQYPINKIRSASSVVLPGGIYELTLDGKVLGVLGESGKQLKQFGWIHEIACPSETELNVAELLKWRVWRQSPARDARMYTGPSGR